MRTFKAEGVVIRRQDFGEADRILTIFTKRYGKVRVMAKGVRRIKSRRGPHVELFNRAIFFIHSGRTFDILTEIQVQDVFPRIRKNLELIGLAYYVCELIDALCAEGQPHSRVYELLVETLSELDGGVIHRFQLNLLSELGFLPRDRYISDINTEAFIEQIIERKLKTRNLFSKLSS